MACTYHAHVISLDVVGSLDTRCQKATKGSDERGKQGEGNHVELDRARRDVHAPHMVGLLVEYRGGSALVCIHLILPGTAVRRGGGQVYICEAWRGRGRDVGRVYHLQRHMDLAARTYEPIPGGEEVGDHPAPDHPAQGSVGHTMADRHEARDIGQPWGCTANMHIGCTAKAPHAGRAHGLHIQGASCRQGTWAAQPRRLMQAGHMGCTAKASHAGRAHGLGAAHVQTTAPKKPSHVLLGERAVRGCLMNFFPMKNPGIEGPQLHPHAELLPHAELQQGGHS